MTKRTLYLVMLCLLAGGVPAARSDTPADSVFVKIVGGPAGAANVVVSFAGQVQSTGEGTLVAGTAVGLNLGGYTGGDTKATDAGALGARIASGADWGGFWLSVGSPLLLTYDVSGSATLSAPPMGPGDVMEVVFFFANGTVVGGTPVVTVDSGSVTTTVTERSAAHALIVADDGDGGDAIAAAGIATGSNDHRLDAPESLVGTIVTACSSCSGTWQTPGDDYAREWFEPKVDPYLTFRVFAGPAGAWKWTWSGDQIVVGDSDALYGAFVYVGDDWMLFRAAGGQ